KPSDSLLRENDHAGRCDGALSDGRKAVIKLGVEAAPRPSGLGEAGPPATPASTENKSEAAKRDACAGDETRRDAAVAGEGSSEACTPQARIVWRKKQDAL
ncbi:MAG: hypothetical protein FD160_3651, partial [Caulobacteraceae bacterium]